MSYTRGVLLAASFVLTASLAAAQTVSVHPVFSTTQTPGYADDPAIWIHPTDPSRSVIIGVDKFEGVYVWNMSGQLIQHLPQGSTSRINNIDVRYDFQLGGQSVDVVATNLRDAGKLAFFTVNPDYVQDDVLTQIAGLQNSGNDIQDASYGLALYSRVSDGALYLIDTGSRDRLRQHLIADDGSGSGIVVTPVRSFVYNGGLAEGLVVDDELGHLYVAEEDVAVHKYVADPSLDVDDPIATFATSDGIVGDREGTALYSCSDGTGYLILSSQGDSTIKVYEREGNNAFVKTIVALNEDGEASLGTDGLDVTSASIPGLFPEGFLVVHDEGGSRYHVYDWRDAAENDLQLCGTGGGDPLPPPPPQGLRVD